MADLAEKHELPIKQVSELSSFSGDSYPRMLLTSWIVLKSEAGQIQS